MKKIAVSIVIVYLFMMIFMAQTVYESDVLNITPMLIGVIFVLYGGVLIIRESKASIDKTIVCENFNEYYSNMKNAMKKRAELKHDFANHSQVLVELMDAEKYPEKSAIINDIRTLLYGEDVVNFSDNDMLNHIFIFNIEKLEKEFTNFEYNISLYGLKDVQSFDFYYIIMLLFNVIEKEMYLASNVEVKMYVKDRTKNSNVIAYSVVGKDFSSIANKRKCSQELKLFKEIIEDIDGTLIFENGKDEKIIAGWMEVEQNV
ncbi:MAG: hypothetical protein J6L69_08065 [Lachnospiraceae bacterium]|nr:hypothetical protein [Lachnospiraceae bacterium]